MHLENLRSFDFSQFFCGQYNHTQLDSVPENLPATGHPGATKERTDTFDSINIRAFYIAEISNAQTIYL